MSNAMPSDVQRNYANSFPGYSASMMNLGGRLTGMMQGFADQQAGVTGMSAPGFAGPEDVSERFESVVDLSDRMLERVEMDLDRARAHPSGLAAASAAAALPSGSATMQTPARRTGASQPVAAAGVAAKPQHRWRDEVCSGGRMNPNLEECTRGRRQGGECVAREGCLQRWGCPCCYHPVRDLRAASSQWGTPLLVITHLAHPPRLHDRRWTTRTVPSFPSCVPSQTQLYHSSCASSNPKSPRWAPPDLPCRHLARTRSRSRPHGTPTRTSPRSTPSCRLRYVHTLLLACRPTPAVLPSSLAPSRPLPARVRLLRSCAPRAHARSLPMRDALCLTQPHQPQAV